MKIQPALIVLFILSLIVTAVMETAAYRLYREYHSRFLLSYFLLLTAWNTFGIFGYILSVLAPFLLPADAGSTISLLFGFLILPVLFVKLYFFTDFIVRLLEKEVHRFFKVGFLPVPHSSYHKRGIYLRFPGLSIRKNKIPVQHCEAEAFYRNRSCFRRRLHPERSRHDGLFPRKWPALVECVRCRYFFRYAGIGVSYPEALLTPVLCVPTRPAGAD
jgi:hypothetical protein